MAKSKISIQYQQGFTLIELMISLVLGLLISAAALQVYMVIVRTNTAQAGAADLQDVSIFGIQGIEKELRIANLGSATKVITNATADTGIVLSRANVQGATTANFDVNWLTRTGSTDTPATTGNVWKGTSGMDIRSDQLTLQYTNVTGTNQVDCESFTVPTNAKVIERYFIRSTSTGLSLVCDAGRIAPAGTGPLAAADAVGTTPGIPGFGDAGQEIMSNIDQFKVLLGVQTEAGQLTYISPADYNALASTATLYHAPIVAVKVGVIARSGKPIVISNPPTSFYQSTLFGTTNTATDTTTKYLRRTYESTSMLRNAQVVVLSTL